MFNLGPWELGIAAVIALLIFGPGKLGSLGSSIGRGIKEFKGALNDDDKDQEALKAPPKQKDSASEPDDEPPADEDERRDQ